MVLRRRPKGRFGKKVSDVSTRENQSTSKLRRKTPEELLRECQAERAAALRIDPSFRISGFAQQNSFIDDVLHNVRSVHGIVAAGITDCLPLRDDRSWGVAGKGQLYPRGHMPEAFVRIVSDGYFEAVGIRLQAGRTFTERDANPASQWW